MNPVKTCRNPLYRSFRRWCADRTGLAATEFVLVFPVVILLLFGLVDVGTGIMVNQRVISASHIVADLVARNEVVDDAILDAAIQGGTLAMSPYDTGTFGVDIASIRFDDEAVPEIVWRETRNMTPNPNVPDNTFDLALENEGTLVVTVTYNYEPLFGNIIIDNIPMQEIAFIRGRRTAVVEREEE